MKNLLKHKFCQRLTEQTDVAVTFQTCIREALHLNTIQDIGYPEWGVNSRDRTSIK
jgi:hypothetical protein